MLHGVILAGGSGTRLWPLSRTHYPKQFLQLLGEYTLLQQTMLRLDSVIPAERMWVVTSAEQEYTVRSQLTALPTVDESQVHVLAEPLPRNTAAAIGLAAIHALRKDPEATLVVLPADHWIESPNTFASLLSEAVWLAQQEVLVTLGIIPDHPATGYGYICCGARLDEQQASFLNGLSVYQVADFVEKPDLPTAQRYVASRGYYWNAGIFLWKAAIILEEISAYLPGLAVGLEEIAQRLNQEHLNQETIEKTIREVYSRLDSVSIDYGVLEKSTRLVVVPADVGWSDLGDWTAIHRLSLKDERGNAFGPNVLDLESENSFIYGNGRKIVTIGLKDTVVVDSEDALLVCAATRSQDVKMIAQHLQNHGENVAHDFPTVHRPWGIYTVLEEGIGFKVKRIIVNPGAALSLQFHRQRDEHWVVVSGVAAVTNGDLQCQLQTGQSTYVPRTAIHRLANPGPDPLEIIEVQTGTYLGEDDIVRLADIYQRDSSSSLS
jgi:mannose-1-phosphate guanylyltransferase/mannose-6-phosphate isomerase